MSAARLVAIQSAERDDSRELKHVCEMTSVRQRHRSPQVRIVNRDSFVAIHQLEEFGVSRLKLLVVTDNGDVVSYPLTHLLVQHVLILVSALFDKIGRASCRERVLI